ncbi:piggyBac transposable element-derived protein 4-like [Montipora capricornis]|uniref:piggyBac transposable element-derived protein 4-like n=1 Tax=Montipora capricornis TaxID=246305 RepID=UPI0035F10FDA
MKRDPEWFNTTLAEVKAFLGLHVLFGIKQLPATRLYWSTVPLIGVTAVQKVMSRNRFDKLSQYLHVNNNANQVPRENPASDKLFKVRPILDRVVECCKMELRPDKNLSVDEMMVKFQGHLGMKHYMPMKPVKRGVKVWEIAEASSGFVCDFEVYTGKRQDGATEHNLGYHVVYDLTRNITGKNHHVFCDNFLHTLNLQKICCRITFICVERRELRGKDFLKELSANNAQVKRLRQGESIFWRKNNLVATVWKDKRLVHFLSSKAIHLEMTQTTANNAMGLLFQYEVPLL